MVIRTASIRDLDKLSKTSYKILIMRRWPFWIKNLKSKIDEWCKLLSPSEELLSRYLKELKRSKDPRLAWNITSYEIHFRREVLRNSEALAALRRIKNIGKQRKGKRVVYLICHEPTDAYCHRRIVAELLKVDLGD